MSEQDFYDLRIRSVQPETEHAVRISLDVPEELGDTFAFLQGQYLTFRANIDGEEVRRSYSICSAVHDEDLSVAIKHIEDGVFSSYANKTLKVGDTLPTMPPTGNFFVPVDKAAARRYLFIAAGSGITPIISNIKTVLFAEDQSEVTLLFGNQRSNTIMFLEALSDLKNRFMERFQWVNILSREDQGSDILNGRLNNRKGGDLSRRLISIANYDEYFICGPESMISEVSRGLRASGVDESKIHYELFATSAEDAKLIIEKHHARAIKWGGKVSKVQVINDGRSTSFELTPDGENILDAGINNGMDLPFSCKAGVCATCKAKLIKGEVDMDVTNGLTAGEIEQGYILTCQSHPVSDHVTVDFD